MFRKLKNNDTVYLHYLFRPFFGIFNSTDMNLKFDPCFSIISSENKIVIVNFETYINISTHTHKDK